MTEKHNEAGKPMKSQYQDRFELVEGRCFEELLTNPILDIAARFWEDERYEAFKVCYSSMRVVDDFVDERKADGRRMSEAEKKIIVTKIDNWFRKVEGALTDGDFHRQLTDTRNLFQIPLWPWQRFSKSMIYDIKHDGFKTFQDFLKYSEGAAVAPASIFIHLCGVKKENGHYRLPEFDAKEVARPIALFSYLVHIMRDFQEDLKRNLNYISEDLTTGNGLNKQLLMEIAHGETIPPGFRNSMQNYKDHATYYCLKSREVLDKTTNYLKPQYQLSLEIIYGLYLQIFERIDVLNSRFTTSELNPPTQDVRDRINMIISSF
jgi:phytoene/squalene synthetase